jgi:DNA-binding PadR family transcriptional regulator
MSARLMVLGVVSQKQATHGYDVYREITSWKAETWSKVRSGSIYHAFTQLEKEGLLKRNSTEKSKDGPAKTSYSITPEGRQELIILLEGALVSLDQEQFAGGLAFMHHLSRAEAIGLAKKRLALYQETCEFMQALPKEAHPATPSTHPEIIDSWTVLFTATLQQQQRFIEHLEAGNYIFADETGV